MNSTVATILAFTPHFCAVVTAIIGGAFAGMSMDKYINAVILNASIDSPETIKNLLQTAKKFHTIGLFLLVFAGVIVGMVIGMLLTMRMFNLP